MEFRTRGREPIIVKDGDEVVKLEEKRTYHIAVQLGETAREGWRCWFGDIALEWRESIPGFELNTSFWVGKASLRLQTPERERQVRVQVLPREEKLSAEAWASLLRDLDTWLGGSTVGQEGGVHGEVGLDGSEAPGAASILGPLVPAFLSSLEALLKAPRERSVEHWTEVPLHAVRQADGGTLRHLARHPDLWQRVRGEAEEGHDGRQALVPQRAWKGHLDHPANRYVAWMAYQVKRKLQQVAEWVRKAGKRQSLDPDLKSWCERRAERLEEGAEGLDTLLRRSALGSLTPEPASEAAFLTLVDDPVYARVHKLGQLFLSPRFRLTDEEVEAAAPVRPSYDLYELWTFFRLRDVLASCLPRADWTSHGVEQLRLFSARALTASYTAHCPGRGTLGIFFNLTFPSPLKNKNSPYRSISAERRPDLVVTWKPEQGEARWLCLDAKYRSEASQVADAFTSAHIYRDSLRWDGFGKDGRCAGAVLLVPATDPKGEHWFEKDFRDSHGVGAFQLTPGQPSPDVLIDWLNERLGSLKEERRHSGGPSVDPTPQAPRDSSC
jgi:hypothetical protein